jgi:hypothetical protein
MTEDGDDAEARDTLRDRMPRLLECMCEIASGIVEDDETGRELAHHLGAALTAAYRLRAETSPDVAVEAE